MKKLLSILASLVVAGSSAATVIACSNDVSAHADGQYNPNDIDDEPADNRQGNSGPSAVTPDKPNNNNSNKPNNSGNNNNKPSTNPSNGAQLTPATEDEIKTAATGAYEKKILQDQFGIDGKYLSDQLGGAISKVNDSTIDASGLNTKGTYGSAQFPLLDFLHRSGVFDGKDENKSAAENKKAGDDLYNSILGILGTIDTIDVPNPSQLAGTLSAAMPLLPTLLPTIKNALPQDKLAEVKTQADKYLSNPATKKIVNAFVSRDNTLDSSFDKETVGDSLKSIFIGAAYIVAVGFNDRTTANNFSDLTAVNKFEKGDNSAINYLSNTIAGIVAKTIDINKFDINNFSTDQDINTIVNTVKLLAMYMEQFNNYQFKDGDTNKPDVNHVFNKTKDGKLESTYEVITEVRNKTIGDTGFNFNVLKFLSSVSYYLGKLDTPDGVFRLQAIAAMFFDDIDRSSADKILLSWNNDYSSYSETQVRAGEAEEMAPVNKLIDTLIPKVLNSIDHTDIEKQLNDLKSKPVIGGLFKNIQWANIVDCARHDVYMLLQDISWNKPFGFGNQTIMSVAGYNVKMTVLDSGIEHAGGITNPIGTALYGLLPFDGLRVLPEWSLLENQGFLNYLFNGNVYSLIESIAPHHVAPDGTIVESPLKKTYDAIEKFSKGLEDKLQGVLVDGTKDEKTGKQTPGLLPTIAPFTTRIDEGETVQFNGSLGDYDKITFKNSQNKTSVLNLDLDHDNPVNGNYDKKAKYSVSGYPDPYIGHVSAKNNGDGTSTLKISAKNIYVDGDYTADKFADTLYIKGGELTSPVKLNVTGNNVLSGSDNKNIDYTATFKGKVTNDMKVIGVAYNYVGYNKTIFGVHSDYVYAQRSVQNDVNVSWLDDGIGLSNTLMNFDFSGDSWKNVSSLQIPKDEIDKYKSITKGLTAVGVKKDTKEEVPALKGISTNTSGFLNMSSVAAWNLSSLLGMIGLPQFQADKSPLGLPVADDHTVGSLILEVGNLIDDGKLDQYTANLNPENFKGLVNGILGTDNDNQNVVDKFYDAMTGDEKNFAAAIKNMLGYTSQTGVYKKDSILGGLIAGFTPDAIGATDPKSTTVNGDASQDTPLWNYLFNKDTDNGELGLVFKAWNLVNSKDNKALLRKMNSDDNYTTDWVAAFENAATDKDGNVVVTLNINYKYSWNTYIKKDGDPMAEVRTTYNDDPTKSYDDKTPHQNMGVNYTLTITVKGANNYSYKIVRN